MHSKLRLRIATACILFGLSTIYFLLDQTNASTVEQPVAVKPVPDKHYTKDIKPVLESRCVVCHACYDAPCQLKLGSYEGLARGANKQRVYNGKRLIEGNLTRLFEDAHTTADWREKGFFPVIREVTNSPQENTPSAVMAALLDLKQQYPLPAQPLLGEAFDLNINRQYQCPTNDEIADYSKRNPLWGMPYGLPQLTSDEHQLLSGWIASGAPGADQVVISPSTAKAIQQWETFFNQDSNKAQLVSRYLFEHLFLVHLYFEDGQTGKNTAQQQPQFFKLVRSATPPGEAIQGIYTRRPFDDPGVKRVYYRIQPVLETLVHKSHMPLALSDQRMAHWRELFLEPDYTVTTLPSYKPEEASNPFITFAQIPLLERYRYLLEESQNTIMQFIKGPVCRGQIALNVINDHFWVLFTDPALEVVENDDAFMRQARQEIQLPAEQESNALPTAWISYAAKERKYLNAKSKFIKNHIVNKVPIDLNLLWDGDGNNENAALTVFRHHDAASVVKGLIGDRPQTAWILNYPLFERIHYLLVAGYDVYGNLGHQLNSRMYMDFLRMEGEFNFLSLLPEDARKQTRRNWYRGSVSEVTKFVYKANEVTPPTNMTYTTDDPLQELYNRIKQHQQKLLSHKHDLNNGFANAQALAAFDRINQLQGSGVAVLPQSAILQVTHNGNQHFYTLLRHAAYTNISHLFNEKERRLPDEDTLTIAYGLMTSHPNAFLTVELENLPAFADAIATIKTEADYQRFMDNYGIRRTNKNFWAYSDAMHNYFKQQDAIDFGYLDFNRLEDR